MPETAGIGPVVVGVLLGLVAGGFEVAVVGPAADALGVAAPAGLEAPALDGAALDGVGAAVALHPAATSRAATASSEPSLRWRG